MQLFKNHKKGMMQMVDKLIYGLVGFIVLMGVASAVIPTAQSYGDTLNKTGVPFGSFFASSGVVFIIIMAGILIGVFYYFKHKGSK